MRKKFPMAASETNILPKASTQICRQQSRKAIAAYKRCAPQERIVILDVRHASPTEGTGVPRLDMSDPAVVLSLNGDSMRVPREAKPAPIPREADET